MKHTKRLLSMLMVFALILSMGVSALAKTENAVIADAQGGALVFSVKVGDLNVRYTWDDIGGKTGFGAVTNSYGAKNDDGEHTTEAWTGVRLSDILADVEKRTGVTLGGDYKISTVTADSYATGFTVAQAKDSGERYIVAQDAVRNIDGSTAYENSYVRIMRGTEEQFPNQTTLRCILGIEILDASGNKISTPKTKTQGGDAANSYFYIAVKESAGSGFKMYYYTLDELKAFDDIHAFTYVNHEINQTTRARGVYLKTLIDNIADADISDDMIIQYAESDGFHAHQNISVDESGYKDLVGWLDESHVDAGGETNHARSTVIAYEVNITSDAKDEESNPDGVYSWAEETDKNLLRAYKQRPDSNSSIYKCLMGVVISYDGKQLSGSDGYSLSALSSKNEGVTIKEYAAVKGLVPGMEYVVKAPLVTNGTLAAGQSVSQSITVSEGTGTKISFVYDENPYFTVTKGGEKTEYVYTDFLSQELNAQAPSAEEGQALMEELGGSVYGYNNRMLYRYYGVYLDDLLGGMTGSVTLMSSGGAAIALDAADAGKYFVAYGSSQSRGEQNTAESKRALVVYDSPFVICPGEELLVCVNDDHEILTASSKNAAPEKVLENVTGAVAGGIIFTDLAGYGWAEGEIYYLAENGVVNGTSATTYSPGASLRRGDFMLMLYRSYDLASVEGADESGQFTDVPEGSYYYDAVLTARRLGIAQGADDAFRPQDSITRQEVMTLVYRTLGVIGISMEERDDLGAFSDAAEIADYAEEAVRALVAEGVINGKDGMIVPENNMTRAEIAAVLYRLLAK